MDLIDKISWQNSKDSKEIISINKLIEQTNQVGLWVTTEIVSRKEKYQKACLEKMIDLANMAVTLPDREKHEFFMRQAIAMVRI